MTRLFSTISVRSLLDAVSTGINSARTGVGSSSTTSSQPVTSLAPCLISLIWPETHRFSRISGHAVYLPAELDG